MCEGDCFTVEEAASILDCKRSRVYDLIADGWLHRPAGGTKKETGGRVTKKSLYQFVVVDRLSCLSVRALKVLRNSRKLFEKSASKNDEANRLSMVEGEGNSDPSPYPQGEGENNSEERKRCLHH